MDYLTALQKGIIKSGSVIAFHKPKSFLDKWIEFFTGKYYHTGIVYIDPSIDPKTIDPNSNDVKFYEVNYARGVEVVNFGGGFVPFDVIDINMDFNSDVKRFADSLIGKHYSWINFFLIVFGLNNDMFGYICSTYVADILKAAKDNLDVAGATPSKLVEELLAQGATITTIDSFAPVK